MTQQTYELIAACQDDDGFYNIKLSCLTWNRHRENWTDSFLTVKLGYVDAYNLFEQLDEALHWEENDAEVHDYEDDEEAGANNARRWGFTS